MELDGQLIGQVLYMRSAVILEDGATLPVVTFGPIGIAPEYKHQGYGLILLEYSMELACKLGAGALCTEGNIDFYGKSGFVVASTKGIRYHGLPEGMKADFFLCKELESGYFDGITGEYATPQGYFVAEENPEEFQAYDAEFPEKEKLVLPGQLG